MAKLTTNDISTSSGLSAAIGAQNVNNDLIEVAMEKTLSRDGTSPNQMEADLDMNGNQILNLPEAVDDTDPVRLGELNDMLDELTLGEFANGVPVGGTTGQLLSKNSNTDYDLEWITASGTGTVTSVAITVPTGLQVSGSPITGAGTLAVSLASGYQGYTTTEANKLAAIEASADVTDTANVTAAGALMDSEVTNLAAVKAFDPTDYATAGHNHTGVYQPADADLDTWAGKTAPSGTVVGTTDTQTLTNKTLTGPVIIGSVFLPAAGNLNWNSGGIVVGESSDYLAFNGAQGYSFSNTVYPGTNDTGSLGFASTAWSDLFLASGAVINFDNGNAAITHSSGVINVSTGTLQQGGSPVTTKAMVPGVITMNIDGGGSAITTGLKGYVTVPYGMTITSWTLLADQSGSIVVDVWKDTYANYPPLVADTITASAKPTLSSVIKNTDSTLTGWTTTVTAGDILAFNVDSATTVTKVTLLIQGTRT